jgi:hypothetical protein
MQILIHTRDDDDDENEAKSDLFRYNTTNMMPSFYKLNNETCT